VDDRLTPLFDEAIARYTVVRDSLATVAKLFPFDVGDVAVMKARLAEAERRRTAVDALKSAREAERQGLKTLAKIAKALWAD
jgi:hypothetical protein